MPVGCVFVSSEGVEVACGANETNVEMCATRHAELVAIDGAMSRAAQRGQQVDWTTCELYVTCEPCIMCASALSQMGIAKCYFGCRNDKFGGCGSILSLHEGHFECVEGIMKDAAVDLFRTFYDRENVRTKHSDARGDKRTRRRTAKALAKAEGAEAASLAATVPGNL